ncbi:MAG: DUF3775 domain-containing protein [Confluentimicrobium sp.]|jgi:hypothetical protein|uniref:DUF3775 domain-containing protein n=1 Tax=Actibacterium naphthalenivorans TaxID=1614693 RepID=A0A840CI83_9RHOB|nr:MULTISPECIES: DUF3775 domain-containing protein [Actibacterium]KGB80804.1 hypothetical protein JT55_16925 [Rhodovulum sp. NI22]MDY6858322.1 DUF3775 domain-containing protein [Pseudomonadota bacterium]ALG91533.1 hypothetical protein TQ29_16720 [Actibacterium sp. EMB200-NS6]MBB4021857.1 hypothetical protein [Actibacterium naphthalenivorans]MBC55442.1 DUF3775 domain-containing protein [Actibacterium sp.]|tara:strand:+ start:1359 stop:1751 length:393 start_codon:yes stop_codon:yes gene_type:complete
MLEISPNKVAHVIVRAREIDAKVGRWDSPGDVADADTILEARAGDATEKELRAFINGLNADEQASLVAVMWIGRDTFGADDLEEAIQTARDEADTPTADYLLGVPLLSDYLESGLEALNYDVTDLEEDLY